MPLDPVSLMAILQQLQQQGGQGQGQIPPAQVSPQPPAQGFGGMFGNDILTPGDKNPRTGQPIPMPAGGIGQQAQSPAAMPPMGGQDQNPLMQMARRAMSNPQAQTIPQPPTAPSTSSAHPILAKILSALASGMQNFGYGMQTGPQQLQRQALDAQKSEAMARLGMEQAQLAETQRYHTGELGEAAKRTAIESSRQQEEAGFHKGTLGIETQRAGTEAAAQKETAGYHTKEFEMRQKELDQQHAKLEEETRGHKAEEKIGMAHVGVEQRANDLKQKQLDLDKDRIQQQLQITGLGFSRETMEKERAARIQAVEDHYKEHNWMTMWGGLSGRQKDIDTINQDIDAREGQAAGAAGVPSFGPQQQGGARQQQQQGGTRPARFVNGQWVDAQTNQPIK